MDDYSNHKSPPYEAPPGWYWVFEESWALYRRCAKPMDPVVWVMPNGGAKGEHAWMLIRRDADRRLDPNGVMAGVEETVQAALAVADKAVLRG